MLVKLLVASFLLCCCLTSCVPLKESSYGQVYQIIESLAVDENWKDLCSLLSTVRDEDATVMSEYIKSKLSHFNCSEVNPITDGKEEIFQQHKNTKTDMISFDSDRNLESLLNFDDDVQSVEDQFGAADFDLACADCSIHTDDVKIISVFEGNENNEGLPTQKHFRILVNVCLLAGTVTICIIIYLCSQLYAKPRGSEPVLLSYYPRSREFSN